MKSRFKNVTKLLTVTGCVSVLAYNLAAAAPQTYDMSQPAVRSEYNAPNKISLSGNVNFDDYGQTINLSLRNTDVQQVLRMFADKAGLNIVFHESATGFVTLDLVDVRLEDALNMVMKMSNLTYIIKNKTMMVVAIDQAEKLSLSTDNIEILPVKYADATYLADFLNKNIFGINTPGLSYGPIVSVNTDRNELLIFGTDSDYQMAKKIVDRFDKKPLFTTYRVNHTTPFEMARMICETLLRVPFEGTKDQGKVIKNLDKKESKEDYKEGTLGAGSVACSYTTGFTENITSYTSKPSLVLYVQPEIGTLTLMGGSEHQIQMVNDFIVEHDRKQPQAFLELSIIALTEDGSKDFQNNWAMGNKHISFTWDPNSGLQTGYVWHGGPHATGSNRFTLVQQISYLVSNSKARILANPKIIVTNGKKSTIDLTQDYIKKTDVQILEGNNGNILGVEKTFEIGDDNGIKVDVTPFISPDGYVSLDIKPEYASEYKPVIDTMNGEQYTAAVLLERHNLDLKSIRIKDEETLLLGGLVEQHESNTVAKIPILGDLPLVGFFFRNQSKQMKKNEILMLITPRIIKDTEDVAEL